jgi:streptogramin lyase
MPRRGSPASAGAHAKAAKACATSGPPSRPTAYTGRKCGRNSCWLYRPAQWPSRERIARSYPKIRREAPRLPQGRMAPYGSSRAVTSTAHHHWRDHRVPIAFAHRFLFADRHWTPDTAPLGITAGPDGALWFTEEGVNQVGRITTAGVLREYPLTALCCWPEYIAAGPDGALWFAETYGYLFRVSTAGVFTQYFAPLPGEGDPTQWIAAGPDGSSWLFWRDRGRTGRRHLV